jgi:hypothetical protein
MRVGLLRPDVLELWDHVPVVQDRPRNQMREIGDEKGVMRPGIMRDLSAVGIDQEGDLGEGVKGNSDRKQDVD